MTTLMRHVAAVQNVHLPGELLPFRLDERQVGWVMPRSAALLLAQGACRQMGDAIVMRRADDLPEAARDLAAAGAFPWRGEAFDVRDAPDHDPLTTVDRGALPWFGIAAEGVHVNGLVQRDDGIYLWVARRAANRLMDPGKLDHLFAGGIAAGFTAEETLFKEGAEEAGLGDDIVEQARYVGSIRYTTRRAEGLRRDRLHCYDLWLPEAVRPVPCDGEVAAFELWPLTRVLHSLRHEDSFKFNVTLVLIDLLLRLGLLPRDDPETRALRRAFGK